MTRIYVGGLGEGVTAEDIERAFSSLGSVSRVEIVARSHGSPFGFMDFEPKSDKSMSRLFANYNGCFWKGGKLKVEKASEHYIDRLKREWAESAEITKNVDVPQETIEKAQPLRGPKFKVEEKKQLKIFFPKLRKVKSLSFTGTGRHKYSFQRVNVPPLPVHFCDCEEHIKSEEETKTTSRVSPNEKHGFIDEEELNMMQSVMSKLFAKEVGLSDIEETKMAEALPLTSNGRSVETNSDHRTITKQEIQEVDNDDVDDDNDEVDGDNDVDASGGDDDLVMNIGIRGNRATLDSILKGKEKELSAAQDRKRTSEQIDKKKSSKKRQKTESDPLAEADVNKCDPQLENGSGVAESPKIPSGEKIKSKYQTPQSEDGPELQPGIAQTKESIATKKPGRVASWVQKSSWRDLVGDSVSSSFSISHVLPGTISKKTDAKESCGTQSDGFDKSRKTTRCRAFSPIAGESDPVVSGPEPTEQPGDEGVTLEKDEHGAQETQGENGKAAEEKSNGGSNNGSIRLDAIGETCSFMRSADSHQQWLKAKSAMNNYLKKKCLTNGSEDKPRNRGN